MGGGGVVNSAVPGSVHCLVGYVTAFPFQSRLTGQLYLQPVIKPSGVRPHPLHLPDAICDVHWPSLFFTALPPQCINVNKN